MRVNQRENVTCEVCCSHKKGSCQKDKIEITVTLCSAFFAKEVNAEQVWNVPPSISTKMTDTEESTKKNKVKNSSALAKQTKERNQ